MKRFSLSILLSLVFLVGCQSIPEFGSVDQNRVELINGKARNIDILSINDFHGALVEDPKDKNVGAAKLATIIFDTKKANPNTLLVAGGDLYQGNALSAITKGAVVNDYLAYLGLIDSAVGNHEFDWGPDNFATWSKDGKFPFLAANIIEKKTGQVPTWAKPYHVILLGGHKIAFVGFSTMETLTKAKADFLVSYDFQDPSKVAAKLIPEIIHQEKPELIIAVTHIPAIADTNDTTKVLGMAELNELDALVKIPGINAVVTGHSHYMVAGTTNGIPVVQAYYNGRAVSKLAVNFTADNTFTITPSNIEAFKTKDKIAEDAGAKKIYDDYNARYGAELAKKVAIVSGNLSHSNTANVTPMGKWVCDVLKARYGVQVYVQNGGGLRKGFVAGEVTVNDFWELMPFDNYTVTFKTTGKVLKEIIASGLDSEDFGNGQFSGVKVKYNPAVTGAAKIVSLTLDDGSEVSDSALYSVGTNDFQFSGGDKYTMIMPNATEVKETFDPLRDILIEAAKKSGTIVAPSIEGIVTKPPSSASRVKWRSSGMPTGEQIFTYLSRLAY